MRKVKADALNTLRMKYAGKWVAMNEEGEVFGEAGSPVELSPILKQLPPEKRAFGIYVDYGLGCI